MSNNKPFSKWKPRHHAAEWGITTNEQHELCADLMKLTKQVSAFEIEGTLFIGDYTEACKRYAVMSPSKKFYIWLKDNYTYFE